jgi:hypothetical protein
MTMNMDWLGIRADEQRKAVKMAKQRAGSFVCCRGNRVKMSETFGRHNLSI